MIQRILIVITGAMLAAAGLSNRVAASVHLWQINELYADASRPLEFIELFTNSGSQNLFKTGGNNSRLVSRTTGGAVHDTFTFPGDAPSTATTNHAILIGTANLSTVGSVTPDFTLPDGFLLPGGGRLDFVSDFFGTIASITYPALPTGQNSYDVPSQAAVLNSPKNFAGTVGLVPLNNVWHHEPQPLDINADTRIDALDVLLIVNELNAHSTHTLELPPLTSTPPPYYDASGDDLVSPLDALQVVNYINDHLATIASAAASNGSLLTVAAVPEPSSWLLAFLAAIVLWSARRSVAKPK